MRRDIFTLASRNILILLIVILAVNLAAGIAEVTTTGSNIAIGEATVQGDVFSLRPNGHYYTNSLYSGVWAHVYIPSGNDGINSGISERIVQDRTDTKTTIVTGNECTITNRYGPSTLIAKASKTGVLGSAEAFSEVSASSETLDELVQDIGYARGNSQIIAYISHSGTGTANASADGSAEYSAAIKGGHLQAWGSVDGSAALDAANKQGGYVIGAAFTTSFSDTIKFGGTSARSLSIEYLSLESSRNTLSAKSTIDGIASGGASANGFIALSGTPGKYTSSNSSLTGDLSATAITYKLGDYIRPSATATVPFWLTTQLDNQISTGKTGIKEPLYSMFSAKLAASACLLSQSEGNYMDGAPEYHKSTAQTESSTSSGVTKNLADASEAYGASYINQGTLFTKAYTSSAAGMSPITLASADADDIFMGSGAHLVSRLTGAQPASYADLTIESISNADGTAFVDVNGDAGNTFVKSVGPLYSPSGTFADATGSYLAAANIGGTAVHNADAIFTAPSQRIAENISEINIWSWIAGDDHRTHAESIHGLTPFVSSPVYTADPAAVSSKYTITNMTSGPIVTPAQNVTSRSVSIAFDSGITTIV